MGLLAIIKNTQGIYQTLRHQKAKGTETGGCNEGHSFPLCNQKRHTKKERIALNATKSQLMWHGWNHDCTMTINYVNMKGETANHWSEKTQFICEECLVRSAIMKTCEKTIIATYMHFRSSVKTSLIAPWLLTTWTWRVKLQTTDQKRHSLSAKSAWCVATKDCNECNEGLPLRIGSLRSENIHKLPTKHYDSFQIGVDTSHLWSEKTHGNFAAFHKAGDANTKCEATKNTICSGCSHVFIPTIHGDLL